MEEITAALFARQDPGFRQFQCALIPTVDPERVIGVRTPTLREIAAAWRKDPRVEAFLEELPHRYYEENNLHGYLIGEIRDYPACITRVERFLPYVDNWATCDCLRPKCFRKHRGELPERIRVWLVSDHSYTVRFGIGMLMTHFLDEDFDPEYPRMVAAVPGGEYYVDMMIAWYFATALAKQWEAVLSYLEENRLGQWVHNKTIRKAVESCRISEERKKYLSGLKR